MSAPIRYLAAFAPFLTLVARAQPASGSDIFDTTGIFGILCNVQTALTGPIGIAIGVIVLAIGGLMIAFGGKRSVGFVIWGIVGVGIALAAPTLLTALFGGTSTCGPAV
jgi:type IV secretory pathway VirB2 component (pilin)